MDPIFDLNTVTHGDTLLISQNLRLGHSTNSQIFGCACCQALNSHCPQFFHQSPHTLKAFVGQCSFCSFCVSLQSQETTKKINLRSAATRCHLDLLTTSPRNKVPFVDVTPHSQSTRAWVGVRDLVSRCFFLCTSKSLH